MKVKEFIVRAVRVLSAVLFLSAGLSMVAMAEEPVTVKVPVKLIVSGSAPEETYRIKIEREAVNPSAPLASPSEIQVSGSGARDYALEFNEMVYTNPGEYKYTISQVPGNQEHFTYDSKGYTLVVKVYRLTVDKDGNPVNPYLYAVYWTGREGSTKKNGEIAFNNSYQRGGSPNNPGGGGGGNTPGPNPSSPSPSAPNPSTPDPKIPTVEGESRPVINPVDIFKKTPKVLRAIRKIATGDNSIMALYGLFALTAMLSLTFWGFGQRKKAKKSGQNA